MSETDKKTLNSAENDYDDKFGFDAKASQPNESTDQSRQQLAGTERDQGKDGKKAIADTAAGKAGVAAASATGSPIAGQAAKLLGKIRINKKGSGAIFAVIAVAALWAVISMFGSMSMIINLTENGLDTNNGGESAFQRRIAKVLGLKLSEPDNLCDTKRVKCKMGRITTSGLKKLDRKGVVAKAKDGTRLSTSSGKYPAAKIFIYEIDGKKIKPADIKGYLANNPKAAAKILGRAGAFNLRYELWRGGVMKKHFFDRFGIRRDGGLADGKSKTGTKLADITKRVKERLPALDGLREKASAKISVKTDKMLNRGKRGGTQYLVAVGGCVLVQAPTMIAYGVAAVQAARLLPLISDVVLSPGSKTKASFISDISPGDVDTVGRVLTSTDENGKSALDSRFLKHEIGVNTNKTGVSKDFAPGYKVMTSPFFAAANDLNESEVKTSTCNVVLSPQAMYAAIAVNTAITVAASATVIGGVAKAAIDIVVGYVVAEIAKEAVSWLGDKIIDDLAQNDELDKALEGQPGEKLGDALGTSLMLFKSTGAAARSVPVLRENELTAYNKIQAEQADLQRKMDIASLSPFDISSKYTALGSITNSINMAIVEKGGSTGNYATSVLAYLTNLPTNIMRSTTVSAAEYQNSCTYAADFGMTADNGATPAVNAAGMPCYGYTGNMSVESAIDHATSPDNKGDIWVKDGDIPEEASLQDIVKEETRLDDYLIGCGSQAIEDGEWNSTASGCTIDPEDAETEAVAAFSMDYQISQMVDGFDIETAGSPTESGTPTGGGVAIAGSTAELAQKILDLEKAGKITLYTLRSEDVATRTTPKLQLTDIAAGKSPAVSVRCKYTAPSPINPDPKLLAFLADLGTQYQYLITSLFGQCHTSAASDHHSGSAVDFGCPFDTSIPDAVGKKYGVSRNGENCANDKHYHYRTGG